MIKISKTYNIIGGQAPYNYSIITSKPCIGVEGNITGVSNGTINVIYTFTNSSCFIGTSQATVYITDANGCSQELVTNFTSPCLQVVPVITTNINSFQGYIELLLTIPGGLPPNTSVQSLQWIYDINLLEDFSNQIFTLRTRLKPKDPNNPPVNTQVTAILTLSNGCVSQVTYNVGFQVPVAVNSSLISYCAPSPINGFSLTPILSLDFQENGAPIDWSTLEFTLPSGIELIRNEASVSNPSYKRNVQFRINPSVTGGNIYNINFRARNSFNLQTLIDGVVSITVPNCSTVSSLLSIISTTVNIDCNNPSAIFTIDLNPLVLHSNPLDWNTFAFIPGNGQLALGSGLNSTIDTGKGSASINANNVITYIVLNPNIGDTDYLMIVISDNQGNQSNVGLININYDCIAVPEVFNGENIVACGSSTTIDLTPYIQGETIDYSTLIITEQPQAGNVFSLNNGSVQYNANPEVSGNFSFKFKVANGQGGYSAEATMSIIHICAGGLPIVYFGCSNTLF